MRWSSTTAGRLFTGTPAWRLELANDSISLYIAGYDLYEAHVAQLWSLELFRGRVWATCELAFRTSGGCFEYTLGGIPNADAQQMFDELSLAINAALKRLANDYKSSMRVWIDEVVACFHLDEQVTVESDHVDAAMRAVAAPTPPAGLTWELIRKHPCASPGVIYNFRFSQ